MDFLQFSFHVKPTSKIKSFHVKHTYSYAHINQNSSDLLLTSLAVRSQIYALKNPWGFCCFCSVSVSISLYNRIPLPRHIARDNPFLTTLFISVIRSAKKHNDCHIAYSPVFRQHQTHNLLVANSILRSSTSLKFSKTRNRSFATV